MQSVLVAVEPSTFKHLFAAGSILFIPHVRCGRCMGSGLDDGQSCPVCLDSAVRGWMPIEPTAALGPIVEPLDEHGPTKTRILDRCRERSATVSS